MFIKKINWDLNERRDWRIKRGGNGISKIQGLSVAWAKEVCRREKKNLWIGPRNPKNKRKRLVSQKCASFALCFRFHPISSFCVSPFFTLKYFKNILYIIIFKKLF